MTNVIELQSVTRAFGGPRALDDVTLTVPAGSIVGLLGRNGAGKTTLMSLIAGQDRPSSGRVAVFGQNPFENESVLSRVRFVRDNQRYPDGYTLRHVLRIAPTYAPNWDADVAAELADAMRIPDKVPVKSFSRGQLSAVAILLSLAARAPVTLLDEPYLGLDVTARARFHDVLIRDYVAHPRTVVLSTHLIEESEALFDRVIIMDRGRVRADLPSEQVPTHAFVLSGPGEAVDRLATDRTVLSTHAVPGLKSVTVHGAPEVGLVADAASSGVQVSAASLQELVAAFGADSREPVTLANGPRS
ncbi:ABC transporter related protein [Xylanimonas cellulosilytica DSM 15894]|uniref:ABC transporter related protein n=1 Tax=Xylanimonas cellulosilytica (strain DSM 15894 / JCM 12276 / CECT 5975 / KCTC 9989 / LMG 20990 / NBRC 107835 / XIL07) TaxID=446471 RepID=D1BVI2_XYLCX|nr:ABC transporter ATP-binding protein [Xylanimonas cellulosilytica]ACZ29453.1 ABC transporter related protein [Xylanimonas cellulosilytica DSM 15894]